MKHLGRGFIAHTVYWSTKTAPQQLMNFIPEAHVGDWRQHFCTFIRRSNILDQVSAQGLRDFGISVYNNFPSNDHKAVPCVLHDRPRPRTH